MRLRNQHRRFGENLYITLLWVKSVSCRLLSFLQSCLARAPSCWRNSAIQLKPKVPLCQHDDPSSKAHTHLGTSHVTLLTPRSRREGNPWLRPPPLHRRRCDDGYLPRSRVVIGVIKNPPPRPGMIIAEIIGQWVLNPFSAPASAPDLKTA